MVWRLRPRMPNNLGNERAASSLDNTAAALPGYQHRAQYRRRLGLLLLLLRPPPELRSAYRGSFCLIGFIDWIGHISNLSPFGCALRF